MSKDKLLLVIVAVVLGFGIHVNQTNVSANHNKDVPMEQISPEEENNKEEDEYPEQEKEPSEPDVALEAKTMAEALEMAKKYNKNIFLYFGAEWCGPCNRMKGETLVAPEVVQILKNYIVLKLNTDIEAELSMKYGVRAIPSYFIIDKNEARLHDGNGFKNVKVFVKWFDEFTPKNKKQGKKK